MMNQIAVFLTGTGVTALACIVVIVYLKSDLNRVLVDLCGTGERAGFWTSFTSVTLVLVPVLFAMHYEPEAGTGSAVHAFFEIVTQLKWGLMGLAGSVLVIGGVISATITGAKVAG